MVTNNKVALRIDVVRHTEVESAEIRIAMRPCQPGTPDFQESKPDNIESLKVNVKQTNQTFTVPIPVRIPLSGQSKYEVDIRLRGKTPGGGFSDRVIRYLMLDNTGKYRMTTATDEATERHALRRKRFEEDMERNGGRPRTRLLFDDTVTLSPRMARAVKPFRVPTGQLLVRPTGLSDDLRKYATDRGTNAWGERDPITVSGRSVFHDIDGSVRPLVGVGVHLWDYDTFSDDWLGAVATDWDGEWSITVNSDDGALEGGREIYYTCRLENSRLAVQSTSGRVFEWASAVHPDVGDGTVMDFRTETGATDARAMQVWSTLMLAWNHAATVGGQDPGAVACVFPLKTGFRDGKVHVMAEDVDGPDTITHEYGHAVMASAYPSGDPTPGGTHDFYNCTQNMSLAWSEGWATAFMLSVRPDGDYKWHEGPSEYALPIERFW